MQDLACNLNARELRREVRRGNRAELNIDLTPPAGGPPTTIATQAYANLVADQQLDATIKGLIIQCMSTRDVHQPNLDRLLKLCEAWVANSDEHDYAQYYPSPISNAMGNPLETDHAIHTMIQRIILSAPTKPDEILASLGNLFV